MSKKGAPRTNLLSEKGCIKDKTCLKKGCIKDKSFVFYICAKKYETSSRKSRLKQRPLVSKKSVLFLAFYAVLVFASRSLDGENELIFCRVALITIFFC